MNLRTLRMLVISSDLHPPSRVDVSVLFGEELAGRGLQADWLLQSESPRAHVEAVPWGGGTVWVGPTDLGDSLFHRVRKHALGILHDLRLFGLMRSGRYDLIEVKDKFISGLFALLAARLNRRPFVYWLSYPFPEEYLYRAKDANERFRRFYAIRGRVFSWLLYRCLLPRADHIVVQSEQMRRDVAAQGIPMAKVTAVPMGIRHSSVAAPDEQAERTLLPPGVPCFLYLGTLARVRHMDFLVRVLAIVLRAMPTAKLYLVGRGNDPEDMQLLADTARDLQVEHALVMVGQVPQPTGWQYVREADVCVSPFYPMPVLNSTSPTKLVEYMALGKAVVANDHPEQRLVLEQGGGGLCVPYDEAAFAGAVLELLSDPARARRMGAAGRQYVLGHRTYATIADQVEALLLKVASRATP